MKKKSIKQNKKSNRRNLKKICKTKKNIKKVVNENLLN